MRTLKSLVLAIVCSLMLLTTASGSTIVEKHANWLSEKTNSDYKFSYDVTKYIYQTCRHPILILSIVVPESNLNPKATRKKSAVYGLGQIKFSVWKNELKQFKIYRPADLHDWRKNILAMNYITKKYYKESKGNIQKTIAKYTGGYSKSNTKHRTKIANNIYTLNKIKGGHVRS